jgi:hypothetical protein
MKKILILLTLLITPSLWAKDCVKPVTVLKQGIVAPCDGFLFSKEKESEVRYNKEELDLKFKEINLQISKSLDQASEIKDYGVALAAEKQKSKEWQTTAEKYTTKYENEESSRTTRDAIFFAAGIGVALISGVGVVWIVGHTAASAIVGGTL